jgi:hypothetical protein
LLYLRHTVPEICRVRSVRIVNTTGDPLVAVDFADRVRFWGPEVVIEQDDRSEGENEGVDLAFVLHGKLLYTRGSSLVKDVRNALLSARIVVAYDVRTERALRTDREGFSSFRRRAVVYPWILSLMRRLPGPVRRSLL